MTKKYRRRKALTGVRTVFTVKNPCRAGASNLAWGLPANCAGSGAYSFEFADRAGDASKRSLSLFPCDLPRTKRLNARRFDQPRPCAFLCAYLGNAVLNRVLCREETKQMPACHGLFLLRTKKCNFFKNSSCFFEKSLL